MFSPGAPKIVSVDKQYAKFGDLGMVECSIDSVPEPTSIVWTRDGQPLEWADLDRFVNCDFHRGSLQACGNCFETNKLLDDKSCFTCYVFSDEYFRINCCSCLGQPQSKRKNKMSCQL